MRSFFFVLFCALAVIVSTCNAFTTPTPAIAPRTAQTSVTSLNVFGKKKSAAAQQEEAEKAEKFWQGDWVCKDCTLVF